MYREAGEETDDGKEERREAEDDSDMSMKPAVAGVVTKLQVGNHSGICIKFRIHEEIKFSVSPERARPTKERLNCRIQR